MQDLKWPPTFMPAAQGQRTHSARTNKLSPNAQVVHKKSSYSEENFSKLAWFDLTLKCVFTMSPAKVAHFCKIIFLGDVLSSFLSDVMLHDIQSDSRIIATIQ